MFNLTILNELKKEFEKYDAVMARTLCVEHKRVMVSGRLDGGTVIGPIHNQTKECHQMKGRQEEGGLSWQKQLLSTEAAFKTSQGRCHLLQTQIQQKDQEIENQIVEKDYRSEERNCLVLRLRQTQREQERTILRRALIKELTDKVTQMEEKLIRSENNLNKYEKVIVLLKEWARNLQSHCDSFTDGIQGTERRLDKLQKNVDILTAHVRRSQKHHERAMQQREQVIQRYKQQLCASLERENNLKEREVQLELKSQRQSDKMKTDFHLANEKLVQELTLARHQGLTPNDASDEICQLKEQNATLRALINQMRKDIECLNQVQPQATASAQHPGSSDAMPTAPSSNAQISAGPPLLCTHLSSSAKTTDAQQSDRVQHAESTLNAEKNEVLGRLQEYNLCLKQLQTTGPFEKVKSAKGKHPLLHSRLKQAASCIARLSREKQQLIEMGNQLRSQISASELHASVRHKTH